MCENEEGEIGALADIAQEKKEDRHEVICRVGTEHDVIPTVTDLPQKEEPEFYPSFSAEEFEREFRTDPDSRSEYLSDPRSEARTETDEVQCDDRGTLAVRIRIRLPRERDQNAIDVDFSGGESLVLYSHKHKCWVDLPAERRRVGEAKAEWDAKEKVLTVTVRMRRENDTHTVY